MADREKTADADYEVGFGRPPKQTQFRQGRSGNPRGRPRRVQHDAVDIAALLSEPIAVRKGGASATMSAFEAGLRSQARRAIMDGKLDAILEFLKLCEQYRIIELARAPAITGGPGTGMSGRRCSTASAHRLGRESAPAFRAIRPRSHEGAGDGQGR